MQKIDDNSISMGQTSKTIINILLGIAIGLSVRYVTDYVYNSMRKGGLTPELPFVYTDQSGDVRKTDVYIIPFEGFSEFYASQLGKSLSQDLGIIVKTTGSMPFPLGTYNNERKQHVAEKFYEPLYKYSKKIRDDCNPDAVFIGMIADDMYPEDKNWNYCFSLNFDNRVSIIAADRLVPYGILDKNNAARIYGERIAKILKRTIGIQYFNYPRSSEPNSLLYSPLMNLDEVDRMSFEY